MCTPVIAIGLTVASAALGAYGSIQQGQAAQEAAAYNVKTLKQEAKANREAAAYDAQLIRERYARTLASQRAGYGASGVVMEGTPLDVLSQSAFEGERDALNTLYGGELKAKAGYRSAALAKFQGDTAASGYYGQAASTLLGAAGKTYGMGVDYGMWGGSGGGAPDLSGLTVSRNAYER